jgi:hypothetical protein
MAEEFRSKKHASLKDFGQFMAELKQKNPKITGRSTRAIIEAIKERSADFDIPPEWFENRAIFLEQPYNTKIQMLTTLYKPITPDILFQEAQRYFDSEERFAHTEADAQIVKGYNNLMWDVQAQIKYYEEQAAQGEDSAVAKLQQVKRLMAKRMP